MNVLALDRSFLPEPEKQRVWSQFFAHRARPALALQQHGNGRDARADEKEDVMITLAEAVAAAEEVHRLAVNGAHL